MTDFFDDIENVEIEKPEAKTKDIFDSVSSYYRIYISCSNVRFAEECQINNHFYENYITKQLDNLVFSAGTDIHYKVYFDYSKSGKFNDYQICVDIFGIFSTFYDFWKFINTFNVVLLKFKSADIENTIDFKLTDISSVDVLAQFCLDYKHDKLLLERNYSISFIYNFAKYFINNYTGFRDLDSRNPKLSAIYRLTKTEESKLSNKVNDVIASFADFIVHHNDKFYAGSPLNVILPLDFEYSDKASKISANVLSKYAGKKLYARGLLNKLLQIGVCDLSSSKVLTAIGMLYEWKMSTMFVWDGQTPKSFCPETNLSSYPHMWWNYLEESIDELCSAHNKREIKFCAAEDTRHKNKYVFGIYLGEIFDLVSSGRTQRMDPMDVIICFYGSAKSIKKCVDLLYG